MRNDLKHTAHGFQLYAQLGYKVACLIRLRDVGAIRGVTHIIDERDEPVYTQSDVMDGGILNLAKRALCWMASGAWRRSASSFIHWFDSFEGIAGKAQFTGLPLWNGLRRFTNLHISSPS
jgi:hypothetical protein